MLEAPLHEIVPDHLIAAFRKMWEVEGPDAISEVRKLMDVLAEDQDSDEVSRWVAKIIFGLVGQGPDLASWLEAVAVGSFQLRPDMDYAYSGELKSRARHLARQRPMFIGDIEAHRRAWAVEVNQVQAGGLLIAASALMKEMKKNVAAKAAIGPGWPLMVAVNDHFGANEMKALHQFGGEHRLHELLAFGARWALRRFITEFHPHGAPKTSRAADWRRSLPPGVDVRAYFGRPRRTTAAPTDEAAASTDGSYASVQRRILAGSWPSFLDFTALKTMLNTQEEARRAFEDDPFGSSGVPVEPLVPPLAWLTLYNAPSSEECFSRAMRAVARRRHREQLAAVGSPDVATEDYRMQVWLEHWIAEGGGIPKALPIRFFSYLEEEACLAFETKGEQWRGYPTWSGHGLLPREPSKLKPATLVDAQEMNPSEIVWVTPAREVDRILVNAQPDVESDTSE
ncbi:hypothetical protein V6R86_01640 [Sphingomonas kaistensis]|uniref:Zorya protein ZorC EH domain-containing protein n=1 Tax=Sphingomonas kaistensis TaxID=298708 RepID=A0ABZ2FX66_9SPHN